MRAIRGAFRGRLRVYLLTHGKEVRNAIALCSIVLAFIAGLFVRHHEELHNERQAHEQAKRKLAAEQAARTSPPIMYLIEAETIEEAQIKLARVAGQLDMERAKMRSK